MKETLDDKAIRLVANPKGGVDIIHHSDDVLWGYVTGDHGVYRVEINPAGFFCDCRFGVEQGGQHSHTRALEVAALALSMEVI